MSMQNLETPRLVLRPWRESDAAALFKWAVELKETSEAIGCVGYLPASFSNLDIEDDQCEVGGDKPVRVMRLDYAI